jgi:hypothetical protein
VKAPPSLGQKEIFSPADLLALPCVHEFQGSAAVGATRYSIILLKLAAKQCSFCSREQNFNKLWPKKAI